jgi:hypothetical protein
MSLLELNLVISCSIGKEPILTFQESARMKRQHGEGGQRGRGKASNFNIITLQ